MKAVTYVEVDVPEFANGSRSADFDGTNDYLTRGAGLTGAADSKLLTISLWLYIDAGTGGRLIASATTVGGGAAGTRAVLGAGTTSFNLNGLNSAGTMILSLASSSLTVGVWHHIMASVDLSNPLKCHLYVDDQPDLSIVTFTDDTMDFTMADWSVGALADGSAKLDGKIGDLWFAPGVYIDLSDEANRRKFISARRGPVSLGAAGATPTGASPLVFLSGALAGWATNKGTGGGFTTVGALTASIPITETYRFAIPVDYLDPTIDAIPSMKSLSLNPATVSLGEDLGQRASISASFVDHRQDMNGEGYSSGTFWGKWRARYGTKLRNRPMRIIRGLVGQTVAAMDTRHYLIDTTDGPSPDGVYMITAKDVLKLADDERSQAPNVSNGSLAGSINNVVTTATLSPVGIGNLEYPASGWVCFGGKEIVAFTRAGDTLTITRGQLGTDAIAHTNGDRVQLVLRYAGNDVADIVRDLLVNYVDGITAAMVPLAEWQAETAAYLAVIYTATITEPTSVRKLISELINQAALAVWWDDQARLIRLKVLREISTTAATFDDETIVSGSLTVGDQAGKRISQIWTFYGQRNPADQADKVDNYRAALASVDLATESEYGAPAIRKIPARWVGTLTAADRLNGIQLSRFRNPPRAFRFTLFRDQLVSLGLGYQVNWAENQDITGARVNAPIQITKLRIESDYIYVEAEEMLASGVIVVTNSIFLLSAGSVLSHTVPASWNNANNSIEVVAGGGGGWGQSTSGGKGGGGGGYSKIVNQTLTPSSSVSYFVGLGGKGEEPSGGGGASTDGQPTFYGAGTYGASLVAAQQGFRGSGQTSGGSGGQASAGIGTTKTSGGNGGNGSTRDGHNAGGGGGGGAGGPNGNGGNGGGGQGGTTNFGDSGAGGGGADGGFTGGDQRQDHVGGQGGHNRFGFGGGTAAQPIGQQGGGGYGCDFSPPTVGAGKGGAGQQIWTQTVAPIIAAGPGGGGGGGSNTNIAAAGGDYGGGGGGGGEGGDGASGAQGIIVLTWRS
jgi:hypothetical protein